MSEMLLLPSPPEQNTFLHEGEFRHALMYRLKTQVSCALALITWYKDTNHRNIPDNVQELELLGIYVRKGDNGKIEIRIPLPPNIALEAFQFADFCIQRLRGASPSIENARKTGLRLFEHESKHYGLAIGVASTPIYYCISIEYDLDTGTTTFGPNVLINEDSFTATQNMHISAAPGKDMSKPDIKSAKYWAGVIAQQPQ